MRGSIERIVHVGAGSMAVNAQGSRSRHGDGEDRHANREQTRNECAHQPQTGLLLVIRTDISHKTTGANKVTTRRTRNKYEPVALLP